MNEEGQLQLDLLKKTAGIDLQNIIRKLNLHTSSPPKRSSVPTLNFYTMFCKRGKWEDGRAGENLGRAQRYFLGWWKGTGER